MQHIPNRVFSAFDSTDMEKCLGWAKQLRDFAQPKLGLEFFLKHGVEGYRGIAPHAGPIFLDLKLHDIPNQVSGAVNSLLPLHPAFLTLHTSGGAAMMQAARDAAEKAGANRPRLLGVTVLTSLDTGDLAAVGQHQNVQEQVARLALLAKESGMDGIVCAPTEIATVRKVCGPDFILMVPGIRPSWAAANDQKRIMTPREAIDAGASYLVIGRPITSATDPADAARRIQEELTAQAA